MKKMFAGSMLFLMLAAGTVTASAKDPLYSPESVTVTVTPPPGSPKTGDINILAIEGAGLLAVGAAVFSAKRSRREKE